MPMDDDDAADGGGARPPLPPDDRLWRHPSEVGAFGFPTAGFAPAGTDRDAASVRSAPVAAVLVAALAGAVLTFGLLAVTGYSPRVVKHPVVEKVSVTPVVSSPVLGSGSTDGVQAVAQRLGPAIVGLDVERDGDEVHGSGVLFRDDGMLLTSAHVVDDADEIDVRLHDGRRLRGTLIGLDDSTDVAVVDVDADHLPVAVLGSTKDLAIGAPALAIGSSGSGRTASISTGVISAIGRTVQAVDGAALHGMLQTDAPISATACGGALVDTSGAVVGIVSPVASDVAARWGFATPIDLAHKVALQLIQHGQAMLGWLGVEGSDLTAQQLAKLGLAGGARLQGIDAGGPADSAGLRPDDVITEVDGEPVSSMPALMVELREHQPGEHVEIGYVRKGKRDEATVILGQRP
jgi:S1-C subfamily serine protease